MTSAPSLRPAPAAPALSVVIPHYNRLDSVRRLLADLQRQQDASFEVIVVDDHSTADPAAALAAEFPAVRLLRNPRNLGPAVSRNAGIRAARGGVIVGFDSDVTLPDDRTLARVARVFAAQPEIAGVAFRLLAPDGCHDDAPRWWHPVPLARYAGRNFLTCYFSGTAYAFRRDALLEAGLFPEALFMHYEEVELAFRLVDRGARILYCPELFVLHHAHPVSRRSEIKVFYKPRNQLLLAIACLPLPRALAYVVPRLGYQFYVAARDRHLGGFFRALRSALQQTPARWRERRVLRPATFRRLAELRSGQAGARAGFLGS